MSFRIHRALIFCIVITLSLLAVYPPQAAAKTVSVPVSIKGLPSTVSVNVIVDGSQQGTIPGGGTQSFKVDSSKAHTFQVDAEIKGECSSYESREVCSKHKCPNSVWNLDVVSTQNCQTVPVCYDVWYCDPWDPTWCWWDYYCTYEQQCWTNTELTEKGHTFEYLTEHQVVVSDIHGQNVDDWIRDGGSITLSTEQSVVTRDESNVKEKDVFQAWMVNGARMESRNLPLKIDKPYFARAEYATETQLRVKMSSDYGNPTIDNADGWYLKGHEATVSIEKELPSDGFMGALGGRRIFVAWRSPQGIESKDPTFTFAVQEPTTLRAEWRADDSMPITILSALGIIIIAALAVFVLYSRGVFKSKAAKAEPTELEKAKAEIERLKQEQEERPAKRRPVRKKKPPPPAAETTST